MIQIARAMRVITGGLAAGGIGLTVFAGANASADPLYPAPPAPGIAAPMPAPQNVAVAPAQVPNRLLAAPPASNPTLATAPGAQGAAAAPPAAPTGVAGQPAVTPATTGTLREYLQSKGVKLEPQKPQGFNALDITLPVPPRWTQVPDPNVPDAFAVIADRQGTSIYSSNAQVVVYKLVGNFDPRDAITHGYVDSQKLLAWQTTNASMADFGGFPSSVIEGTYRDGDVTVNTSRRNVIATSGRDKYLVSLAVSTDRAVAVADAPATDAIVNGFRVTAPGAASPAPAQAPAPVQAPTAAPVPVPVQTAVPSQVGLPGQAPVRAPVAQVPTAAAAGLPVQAPVPNVAPAPQPAPNLLAMVPGLPPLPNFSFLQH
ncbi:LpqN/LpqT family lipoprotein [Mycobacterium sp. Marseille-P9652]|uniref:LpqN/LpqT family lipoprotein n=1 Tax=Mycobacterium sp. Marseille-P9652 TaxID=2654950 RepID=UPI0012E938FB|nr:LpqN/LpqT family lipoprotein [Mycobacterium sp. Marseille-P9652]